jgi:hypothetical protein
MFRANWLDADINGMYRDRFVYLADCVFQYILSSVALNTSCSKLSNDRVLLASMRWPVEKSRVYELIRDAGHILWPANGAVRPPGHLEVFVEGVADTTLHKRKRDTHGARGGSWETRIMVPWEAMTFGILVLTFAPYHT